MFDSIHEECGVFGIYSKNSEANLGFDMYLGLSTLQHRGEESTGIAVNEGGIITCKKGLGHVAEVFTETDLSKIVGKMAIGHVRYSTTGLVKIENAQPIVVRHKKGNLAVAHNGNIVNAHELKEDLEDAGNIFVGTSDTEIICHLIAKERLTAPSVEDAIINVTKKIRGAYTLLIMSNQKLIALRDPNGFRPLCVGTTPSGDYIFASESAALSIIGAKFEFDVLPGEMIVLQNNELKRIKYSDNPNHSLCIFEYIYFARPDSVIEGLGVHSFREQVGRALATQAPVDADLVAGVPDSGIDAALGYAKESKIPYGTVFTKNKYIGRTFIQNTQTKRKKLVHLKLNPIKSSVYGKKIVLIDDSIVRGTTITEIVKNLRDCGAAEVHLRIASPAFIDACYFGTDIDKKENLITHKKSISDIKTYVGADSLEYLSLDNLDKIAKSINLNGICKGCFTGKYPIDVPKNIAKDKFEQKIPL